MGSTPADPKGEQTDEATGRTRMPMGQWLIENMPRGIDLEIPDRRSDGDRKVPFIDEPEDS